MHKRLWALVLAVGMASCVPIAPVTTPVKPVTPVIAPVIPQPQVFDTVVCEDDACTRPIAGAVVKVHTGQFTYDTQTSNADGYNLWSEPATLTDSDLTFIATGYEQRVASVVVKDLVGHHNLYKLTPLLPPAPSRADMLNVHITFQGLTVNTQQFGSLPWFEAALAWLTPADRQAAYTAKRASLAWPGGDTHALIQLPSGPPLYDEANQPYSADRFPALDWTNGGTAVDWRLSDLVHEVITNGFTKILLFLGGDDGENGFPIAMNQLTLVATELQNTTWGDLRPYVVVLPGWDGVFYGYTPQHVWDYGAKCRSLFIYCGIEHSMGHIPTGEGDADWVGTGQMRTYDLLLSEFGDGKFDDTVWQIAARLLGPAYTRDPDQPAADDPGAPFGADAGQFYLRQPTDRGPIVNCAFEFFEYTWVRGASVDAVNTSRTRLKARGYTCGG